VLKRLRHKAGLTPLLLSVVAIPGCAPSPTLDRVTDRFVAIAPVSDRSCVEDAFAGLVASQRRVLIELFEISDTSSAKDLSLDDESSAALSDAWECA
jgi:hypothetical protein